MLKTIVFLLCINLAKFLSFGEDPNMYKDSQNDTIMLTCILNPSEKYVFSE